MEYASPKLLRLRALAESTPTTSSEWIQRITDLYDLRPRPLAKLFGTRGPTPKQFAEYEVERKLHASLTRKARKEHKKALEISNAAYYAAQR